MGIRYTLNHFMSDCMLGLKLNRNYGKLMLSLFNVIILCSLWDGDDFWFSLYSKCVKQCYHRSFLSAAVRLYNQTCSLKATHTHSFSLSLSLFHIHTHTHTHTPNWQFLTATVQLNSGIFGCAILGAIKNSWVALFFVLCILFFPSY